MQNDHSKAISGLSIAVIIIAALSLACCIIGWIFITMGGNLFNQVGPDYIEEYMRDEGYSYNGYHHGYGSPSTSDITSLINLAIMAGGAALIWEAAMCALSLVAGVMGMKYARNREKLGIVFGWSLAAAIGSLLSGRIVTMVLQIIVTVFAYKDKNTPAWQQAYGQPVQQPYGQPAQQAYSQPVQQPYGQPVQQPYGQPVSAPVQQPAAPAQSAPLGTQQPPADSAGPIQTDSPSNPDGPIERL